MIGPSPRVALSASALARLASDGAWLSRDAVGAAEQARLYRFPHRARRLASRPDSAA